MWPFIPSFQNLQGIKMLAVLEEWNKEDTCHVDNTSRYLFLIMAKLVMDTTIYCLCRRRPHTSLLSLCGLSIVLGNAFMALSMVFVWFLNPLKSPVSVCFLLAHFSAVFSLLPVPMLGLGLLDFLFQDRCCANHRPAGLLLWHTGLTLLVWLGAAVYSYETTTSDSQEVEHFGGLKALVCEVQESVAVNYSVIWLLLVTTGALLPHYSAIPTWYRTANWLSEQRDKLHPVQRSELPCKAASQSALEDAKAKALLQTGLPPPSLSISLMLGYASVWLPYVIISAIFVLLSLAIPAYITVNMLWLQCCNSFLTGVVFWVKSEESGQYTSLEDNVCMWRTYLHLSRGTYADQVNSDAAKAEGHTKTVFNQFDDLV